MLLATAYILVAMAGIFNAVMDRTENSVAFNRSVFNHLDAKYWCKDVSWQYVKFLPFTKYRPDAWHVSKSLMFVCLFAALFVSIKLNPIHLIALAPTLVLTFNIFYNRILKR